MSEKQKTIKKVIIDNKAEIIVPEIKINRIPYYKLEELTHANEKHSKNQKKEALENSLVNIPSTIDLTNNMLQREIDQRKISKKKKRIILSKKNIEEKIESTTVESTSFKPKIKVKPQLKEIKEEEIETNKEPITQIQTKTESKSNFRNSQVEVSLINQTNKTLNQTGLTNKNTNISFKIHRHQNHSSGGQQWPSQFRAQG